MKNHKNIVIRVPVNDHLLLCLARGIKEHATVKNAKAELENVLNGYIDEMLYVQDVKDGHTPGRTIC
jgi:hypothetical protein